MRYKKTTGILEEDIKEKRKSNSGKNDKAENSRVGIQGTIYLEKRIFSDVLF